MWRGHRACDGQDQRPNHHTPRPNHTPGQVLRSCVGNTCLPWAGLEDLACRLGPCGHSWTALPRCSWPGLCHLDRRWPRARSGCPWPLLVAQSQEPESGAGGLRLGRPLAAQATPGPRLPQGEEGVTRAHPIGTWLRVERPADHEASGQCFRRWGTWLNPAGGDNAFPWRGICSLHPPDGGTPRPFPHHSWGWAKAHWSGAWVWGLTLLALCHALGALPNFL